MTKTDILGYSFLIRTFLSYFCPIGYVGKLLSVLFPAYCSCQNKTRRSPNDAHFIYLHLLFVSWPLSMSRERRNVSGIYESFLSDNIEGSRSRRELLISRPDTVLLASNAGASKFLKTHNSQWVGPFGRFNSQCSKWLWLNDHATHR